MNKPNKPTPFQIMLKNTHKELAPFGWTWELLAKKVGYSEQWMYKQIAGNMKEPRPAIRADIKETFANIPRRRRRVHRKTARSK